MGSYKEQQKEKMPKARILYNDGLSVGRISKVLSLSRSTVYRWNAKFAEEKAKNMSANKKITDGACAPTSEKWPMASQSEQGHATGEPQITNTTEPAEQKIARLEKELLEARLCADLYNEMINVAEKKFDIQIRKKAGAKQ